LCESHVLALEYLRNGGASDYYNLGNGQGYSVNEVIEAARKVTNSEIRTRIEAARPGDPSRLIADSSKAHSILGWRPKFCIPGNDHSERVGEWHRTHPDGYAAPEAGLSRNERPFLSRQRREPKTARAKPVRDR
jgi:UDP-glucose 4-epimerase